MCIRYLLQVFIYFPYISIFSVVRTHGFAVKVPDKKVLIEYRENKRAHIKHIIGLNSIHTQQNKEDNKRNEKNKRFRNVPFDLFAMFLKCSQLILQYHNVQPAKKSNPKKKHAQLTRIVYKFIIFFSIAL